LRQFDLDAGLGLELLDRGDQRVVFGLVEALAPPDRDGLLRRGRAGRKQQRRGGGKKRNPSPNSHIPLLFLPHLFF
jgi:hypothetical protein